MTSMVETEPVHQTYDKGTSERKVVVAGDLTIDWNFAFTSSDHNRRVRWTPNLSVNVQREDGGAALLCTVIKKIAESYDDLKDYEVSLIAPLDESGDVDKSVLHHSYAAWHQFPDEEKRPKSWRVEEFLGVTRSEDGQKTIYLNQSDLNDIDKALQNPTNLGGSPK